MACYLLAAILSANKSKAFQSKRMEFLPFFCKASCHSNRCNKTFIAAIKQTTSKKVPTHFPHHKVHYIPPPHLFLKHFVNSVFFLGKIRFLTPKVGSFPRNFRWTPRIPPNSKASFLSKKAPQRKTAEKRRRFPVKCELGMSRVGRLREILSFGGLDLSWAPSL